MKKPLTSYRVCPRYTPGSPATLVGDTPEHIALFVKFAADEAEGYNRCLTGVYGDEKRDFALHHGLGGIAIQSEDTNTRRVAVDVLTGLEAQWRIRKDGSRKLLGTRQLVPEGEALRVLDVEDEGA